MEEDEDEIIEKYVYEGGNHFIDNHFTDKYLLTLFRIYPFLVVNCR